MNRLLITIFLTILLASCSLAETDYPSSMKVNNQEVPYNEEVMKIIDRNDPMNPKIALKQEVPKYQIEVGNSIYRVFDMPTENEDLVYEYDASGKILYQYVITDEEFGRLRDILK